MADSLLRIEVVVARATVQQVHVVQLAPGGTAAAAIEAAGCVSDWQDGQGAFRPLACYGRLIEPGAVLADGDRVEILHALHADAKAQRHARVKAVKKASARRARQGVLDG